MTATIANSFQAVAPYLPDEKEHRRSMAVAINYILEGKVNCVLSVTLRANQTTTTISDPRIGAFSAIVPAMAQTAHGASAIAAGIYVDTITPALGATPASATIHHASSANTDQNILFIILG